MHSIQIKVIDGTPIGQIDKTVDGTIEDAISEVKATLERNRTANPNIPLIFDITINGEPYKE